MSWSVTFIGKHENVIKALEEKSAKLSGDSKAEYDTVLPHLVGLVKENFNNNGIDVVVKVNAGGHGFKGTDGVEQYRQCTASVEQLYGVLV